MCMIEVTDVVTAKTSLSVFGIMFCNYYFLHLSSKIELSLKAYQAFVVELGSNLIQGSGSVLIIEGNQKFWSRTSHEFL